MEQKMDFLNVKPIELELQGLSIATVKNNEQWDLDGFNQYKFVDESEYEDQPSFQKNLSHDLTFLLPTLDQLQDGADGIGQRGCSGGIDQHLRGRIYAHKDKVALKSEYFCLLLTNGMKESKQQEISIPNISVDIFFEILMFLYTSELSVNQENLTSMFLVCDQFLLENGKQICRDFIKTLDNVILERFLLEDDGLCSELTDLYIEQVCSNSSFFLDIERVSKLGKDVLIKILNRDDIQMKEIDIFRSTIEWITCNTVLLSQHPITSASSNITTNATTSSSSTTTTTTTTTTTNSNLNSNSLLIEQQDKNLVSRIFHLIRFPSVDYEDMVSVVEPYSHLIPSNLLLESYRFLSKPKSIPMNETDLLNPRLTPRKKTNQTALVPGCDVISFRCPDHKKCYSVSWPIHNFSAIKSQKHVSNCFEMYGLTWKMWAYPAGEAKHSDSFSVYLEAVRVKEKESYEFLRNTTFFFGILNQKDKDLCHHYPSSPNVLFNYEKSVWGNGLIELKLLYDKSLGYMDNDCVTIQLHILECIALDG
ncbi:hypothetical protein ACTA71_012187 [Dictyostelium dimigraforme]